MGETLSIFDTGNTEKVQQIINQYWDESLLRERKDQAITSYLSMVKRDVGTGFVNQVNRDVVKTNIFLDQLEERWGATVARGVSGVVQWWHKKRWDQTSLYDRDTHRFLTPDQILAGNLEGIADKIKRELPDDISLFINSIDPNEPERIKYGFVMSVLPAIRSGFIQDYDFREYCDNTLPNKSFSEMDFVDVADYFVQNPNNLYRVLVQDCYGIGFGLRTYMRRFPREHADLIAPEQAAFQERFAQAVNNLNVVAEQSSQVGLPMLDIYQIDEAIAQLRKELEPEPGGELTDDDS